MTQSYALARQYLPPYCQRDLLSPLTKFEELIIEHSECGDDDYAISIAEYLLWLLDDPAKNAKSLQIMHGIWFRLMRIRKYVKNSFNPERLKELSRQVSEKALYNMMELAPVQLRWNP